ncbi:hypothetical protein [Rubellimicrobium roseum]|uniref:DUF4118 domain-containing protein n=1 Tax=Rubellimicrobium roseum TaxID=687525 RepID=A0A5C4NNE2_9RHOB|nr:hypothetical protein [Rubellimicrobium roseum]TNC74978.1 hypothetical protein FHG71_02315 [Rubellimicrobium roseum]
MPQLSEALPPPAGGAPVLRDLLGAVTLLLVARAAEPLFFGQGFYATLAIHPFWLVVILASVQGGFFVGVATAAAAAMSMDWPPRPVGVDIAAHYVELAVVPVQWLLAAIVIGGFRQGQIRDEAALSAENVRLRQMNEDLAAEVQRMDATVAALELHLATMEVEAADSNSGGEGDRVPEPGLAALAALARACPDDFEAAFADAVVALGLGGAAFCVRGREPVRTGSASSLTPTDLERLGRWAAEVRPSEAGAFDQWQVAVRIGDDAFVAAMIPARSEGLGDTATEGTATPALSAPEAVTRLAALAAAIGFSGFRPPNRQAPALMALVP